jgi:carbonic anhydrase/acetyltransferase-like protein (isoleucine patch superfamily)
MNRVIFPYQGDLPKIEKGVFVAPTSVVIGRATLSENSNIWFNTVVRADVNTIEIGENTNVQDLSMLHVTEEGPLKIGKNVSIGHSVILHACEVGDSCLIGMGSKILDGAVIGKNSLVAAGSVVPPNKTYPERSYIIGTPAKVKRELTQEEVDFVSNHYKSYLVYKDQYLNDDAYKLK